MVKSIKTEAFVLKKKELLGKDLLVSLFTKEVGKIVSIAKGVKKITSRRSPHIQTGNLIKAQLNSREKSYYLENSSLISGFSNLKKTPEKIKTLYQFFFVLEKLLPEHQKESIVYNLTRSFLVKLSKSTTKEDILSLYLNKILKAFGYIKETHHLNELEAIIFDLINRKMPTF